MGETHEKLPVCACCGKRIDSVILNEFNYDGTDSEIEHKIAAYDECDGGVLVTTYREWTGYELDGEERQSTISCPYCGKFPFSKREGISVYEPVNLIMFEDRTKKGDDLIE